MDNNLVDKFLVDKSRFDGTVMVTGAGGCIGAWVVAILQRSGISVLALDLSEDRRRVALLLGEDEAARVNWQASDITDFTTLRHLAETHNASAIIHLAGLQVPFCAANPALGARVNVEGTINILQVARELGIKRNAYASSIASLALPPGGPYKETLYGAYKLANEHSAFVYWSDWQVPSIGLRPNVVSRLCAGISLYFRDRGGAGHLQRVCRPESRRQTAILARIGHYQNRALPE